MPREGYTSLTVPEELADELEQYGDTRPEQLENVLAAAGNDGPLPDDEVARRLSSLEEQIEKLPNRVTNRLQTELR